MGGMFVSGASREELLFDWTRRLGSFHYTFTLSLLLVFRLPLLLIRSSMVLVADIFKKG
jgi:hypothetical protein